MWDDLEKPENADILDELKAEDYTDRTHGTRACYALGCRGPLCRMAERDRGRERYRERRRAGGASPVAAPPTPARERDAFLRAVMKWHRYERGLSILPGAVYLGDQREKVS